MSERDCQAGDCGVQETYWQQGVGDVDEENGGPRVFLSAAEGDLLNGKHGNQSVRDLGQERLIHGPPEDHKHAPYGQRYPVLVVVEQKSIFIKW